MHARLPEVRIVETEPEAVPLRLLLEADPSEKHIRSYLPRSRCFLATTDGAIAGVCVVQPTAPEVFEVMNIAVASDHQRRGIGTALLHYAMSAVRGWGARRLELGTGTFGHQLAWYQRLGFRVVGVDRDHFLREYDHPICEGGLQHKDMLRLAIVW